MAVEVIVSFKLDFLHAFRGKPDEAKEAMLGFVKDKDYVTVEEFAAGNRMMTVMMPEEKIPELRAAAQDKCTVAKNMTFKRFGLLEPSERGQGPTDARSMRLDI